MRGRSVNGDSSAPVLLVIRNPGLGDLLMQVPALRALRRAFPAHHIAMTCPSWLVPLLDHLGVADSVITESADGRSDADPAFPLDVDDAIVRNAIRRSDSPDAIAVFRPPREAMTRFVLSQRPRKILAFRHPDFPETHDWPVFDRSVHILCRWERVFGCFGVPIARDDYHVDLPGPARDRASGPVILHAGAGSASRRWPLERWGEVAGALRDRGHQVLLTGSRRESADVAEIRRLAALPEAGDLSGDTDVLELMRLIGGARLVLSGDTGIAHIATVLRRRSVTLFGPISPSSWGPPPGVPYHRTLWSGGVGELYGDEADPGLLQISVADVLRAATADGWA